MYRTILLAYDGSLEGRLALREGARMAQIFNARVVLLAVVDPAAGIGYADPVGGYIPVDTIPDFQKILDDGVERLTRMGLKHEARLEFGQPADRITSVAKEIAADLVVVAHHRQGVVARWLLGSVTAALSDSLDCSLLVGRLELSDDVVFGAAPAAVAS